jgi:hypothetical protein
MKHLLHLKEVYERTLRISKAISIPDPPESLLDQLLVLVLLDNISTDNEAAAALYGADKDSSYKPYQKLKSKFKLYFAYKICRLPLPVTTNPNDAKFCCRTFLLHGKECKQQGLVRAAEWLLLTAYRVAEEIEQYSVLRDSAYELAELYSLALPNKQGRNLYYNAFGKYAQIEDLFSLLYNSSCKLLKVFNIRQRRLATHDQLINEIKQQTLSFINLDIVNHHSRLFAYYYKVRADIALLQADFSEMKNISLEAIKGTENLIYQASMLKKLFLEGLTLACCKLGLYEETLEAVKYRQELEGSNLGLTPYVYLYYQIIAYLQLGRYKEAIQVSSSIKVEEVMRHFPEQQATTYYILFAYQHILFNLGRTDESETPDQIKKFRFSRFRNQVQVQEKNKQGHNVHLLVIELFTLVLHSQFDTFIDRVEAIQKYVQRYLSNKSNERNALFLKMLLSAAEVDFDANRLRKEGESNLQMLSRLPNLAFDQDAASNEFLAFEVQWELYLEALKQMS